MLSKYILSIFKHSFNIYVTKLILFTSFLFRCVQYLLKHRADPRLRDKRGFTAIHYAVAGGNQPALEALLEACPTGNLTASSSSTTGKSEPPLPALTPLHLAVRLNKSIVLLDLIFENTIICITGISWTQ